MVLVTENLRGTDVPVPTTNQDSDAIRISNIRISSKSLGRDFSLCPSKQSLSHFFQTSIIQDISCFSESQEGKKGKR